MLHKAALSLLGLMLMLPGAALLAADRSGQAMNFTPLLGFRDGGQLAVTTVDERRNLDGSAVVGLLASVEFEPGQHYEFLYSRQETTLAGLQQGVSLEYVQIGGRLDFRGREWVPYLSGGFGVTRIHARGDEGGSELRPGASVAVGVEWRLTDRLALRTEGRGYLSLTDGSRGLMCVSGGEGAFCELAFAGDVLGQFELTAGMTVRF